MVSTTRVPQTPIAAPTDDLVLRVCGSARDGQIVRLKSPKCTIGSAEQCTLRLRSRSVGRVHCLILRGPSGTVVRRWAPDTRLNGGLFTDALLKAGDRLSVGGIDLEILAASRLPDRPPSEPAEATRDREADPTAQRRREQALEAKHKESERQSFDAQRTQWQTERAAAEQKLRHESEQPKARAADLDARAAELIARADDLGLRAAELAVRAKEMEGREEELNERRAELQSRATELDARTAALESRSGEVTARAEEFDRQAAELDAAAARLAADQTALEDERQQWQTERAEREAELERRAGELDARAAGPAAETVVLEEPEFETPKEEAPVDLAAVFRKIGAKPALPEDGDAEIRLAKLPMRSKLGLDEPPAARSAAEATPTEPTDKEDDGSIDDYMAQLLQRMRSPGGPTAAPASKPAAGPPRPSAAPETPAESGTEPSGPSAEELPPGRRKPTRMSPMTVAPEKQGGLSAMRELANMSAQTALHRHARGQTKKAARGKLLVAAIGLLAGGLLLVLWFHRNAGPLALFAALTGLAVGAIWGLQWAFLTGHLIVNKGRIKWESKPAKKSAGPPAEEKTPPAAADEMASCSSPDDTPTLA